MLFRIVIFLGLALVAHAKPNIVFMLADDLGWNDVGYHGSEIRTPHIDALVGSGLELDRYYTYPLCSPTRAAFLTGRSAIRQGIHGPIGPRGGMPLEEHLLTETLRAAGYQTALAGKWHLGMERVSWHPYRRGFDRSYGHLGPSVDYFTHIWSGGLDWHRDGEILREEGYSTELIAAEAVRQIKSRDKAKPLFLYVAFNAPHTPLQAPEDSIKRYSGIENELRRIYAAMVTSMDEGVGRVLEALEQEGLAQDTLVVWASDNGGGRNTGASNLPLRGSKGNAFEGGIRVPATIRWPGVLPAGEKVDAMVTVQDWFPTLAAATGVEPRNEMPFDGVNVWPVLTEGARVERGDTIIGTEGNYAVFRDGWKLVQFTRRGTDQDATYLYRIADDPLEETDLIGVKPELAEELLASLKAMPRPPSVGTDAPPGRRQGAPGGVTKGKRAKGKGGAGPRNAAALEGSPRETRRPWLETAIKD